MSQIPPGADLNTTPSGPPPPGVTPNFVDPPTLQPALVGVCVVLILLGAVFTSVRLWTNRKRIGVGDWFVICGFILSTAYASILLSFSQYFRHPWDIPVSWYTASYFKRIYAQGMLLGPTIFFSKEAIFLLYFQLFNVRQGFKIAIIIGMVFTGLVYWAGLGVESYYCAAHPGQSWDPLKGSPIIHTCPTSTYWGITQGACAIVIDLYIFVLPIPIILELQLAAKRKLQVLAIFMTALLGIIASIFAEVYRVKLLTDPTDEAWVTGQQLICVVAENWVALIVSCMPSFASFCRMYVAQSSFFLRLSGSFSSSRRQFAKESGGLRNSDTSHYVTIGSSGRNPKNAGNTSQYEDTTYQTPDIKLTSHLDEERGDGNFRSQ